MGFKNVVTNLFWSLLKAQNICFITFLIIFSFNSKNILRLERNSGDCLLIVTYSCEYNINISRIFATLDDWWAYIIIYYAWQI